MMYTLNVGLATHVGSNVGAATVLRELAQFGTVHEYRIAQSATEQTVVANVTFKDPDLSGVVNHLSLLWQQDCIAVSPDNGLTGSLIGPKADQWGQFDPAYFIKM